MRGILHGGLDRLAMWLEDRKSHEAERFEIDPPRPLGCFGPLGPLEAPPDAPGPWSMPSPRPVRAGDRMWLHVVRARAAAWGTAILVPPWKIDRPSLVEGYTALLARSGLDVWLLVPPEHMERAAPDRPSGHGLASLHLARFRALFEQFVVEIRAATAMASARGPVGVVALSLGALAASLAITAAAAPRFAALVAPPADLATVLLRTAIGRRYRRLAERAGSRWPEAGVIRDALAPFDPRRRPAPASRLFLAVGQHDRVALPEGALSLAAAWGVAPRVYPRGHLTLLFSCRALRRDLEAFVSAPPGAIAAQDQARTAVRAALPRP
jgi:hypothetical protein